MSIPITTVEELMSIEENGVYHLAGDIDCSSVGDFQRIHSFKGYLDGRGHKIYNFYSTVGGIFREVTGNVRNFTLDGEVNSSLSTKAFIANRSSGTIEGISVVGKIKNTGPKGETGAIVGTGENGLVVKGCSANISLEGTKNNIGCIVGHVSANLSIIDCEVNVSIL